MVQGLGLGLRQCVLNLKPYTVNLARFWDDCEKARGSVLVLSIAVPFRWVMATSTRQATPWHHFVAHSGRRLDLKPETGVESAVDFWDVCSWP